MARKGGCDSHSFPRCSSTSRCGQCFRALHLLGTQGSISHIKCYMQMWGTLHRWMPTLFGQPEGLAMPYTDIAYRKASTSAAWLHACHLVLWIPNIARGISWNACRFCVPCTETMPSLLLCWPVSQLLQPMPLKDGGKGRDSRACGQCCKLLSLLFKEQK